MGTFTIQFGLRGKIDMKDFVIDGKINKECLKDNLLKILVVTEAFMDIIHDETGEYVVADLDMTDKINEKLKEEA